MNATCHFTRTGPEVLKATVVIRNKTLHVSEGHVRTPDLRVTADSQTWLRFLHQEANLVWALLKIRLHGSPLLLSSLGRCLPS